MWGRGATDMLDLTASIAVSFRYLAGRGLRPEGDLVCLAVADEEALGTHGAAHLAGHEPDAVATDPVITEGGATLLPSPGWSRLLTATAEKRTCWCRLRVRGTPGHASRPLRTDNALVKAAEVVRRIAEWRPAAEIHEVWRRSVNAMGFSPDLDEALVDPARVHDVCLELPEPALARMAHACTHTTFAPRWSTEARRPTSSPTWSPSDS